MIYLVRHGETDWNSQGMIQGIVDIPLNEKGRKQASIIAEELVNVEFDVVFSSPLSRARETCEIIHKGDIILDNRIAEKGHGDFEGLTRDAFPFYDLWCTNKNLTLGNVEPMIDFEKRIFDFFDEIVEKYPNKNILVVCHGGVIRAAKGYFNGKPQDGDYMKAFGFEGNSKVLTFLPKG